MVIVMKKFILPIVGVFAVVAILGGTKVMQIVALIGAGESMVMPPTVVSTVDAKKQQWESILSAVGSLEARQGVVVTADNPGRITEIAFTSGEDVEAGAILVQQDISSEQAQLRAAEASVALAKANLTRATELLRKRVSSKAEFDAADARYKEVLAQADNIRTDIEKKTIKAPFAGRIGIRQVNVGQDISRGDPIVSLQAVDPILVNFYLPQQELSKLNSGLAIRVISDAVPGQVFTGTVSAVNSEINASTRNVQVQATLSNESQVLLPGMFVQVEIVLPAIDEVLVVPQTAVAYATYGDSVFVVTEQVNEKTGESETVALQKFVRLGVTKGDYVVIEKGAEAGDTVVSAGVFKLRNGATVAVNNDVQPEFSTKPTPEDT